MKTLVAGFGNVLLGDDGFGVEVVRRLRRCALPAGVETLDVGIGGFDFVLTVMGKFDRAIIVDAVRHGKPAGTLHLFRPTEADLTREVDATNPHIAEPTVAMSLARRLDSLPAEVTVVGCEPSACELGIGLSPAVEQCVDAAVSAILNVLGGEGDVAH